ncbi:hypothetical protein AHA02nite_21080 [Alkalibacillus haloalkaliphilus]|uniref:Uncharacterized protein n=1 Tax=Alkalibacillus haloalkaliphilus TaxID=94136 RepID=A0A511WAH9_9BACI|nr:hypothetical protein AHA02nite_21080 [Alkalibacillus haloalkaliphilus]
MAEINGTKWYDEIKKNEAGDLVDAKLVQYYTAQFKFKYICMGDF